MAKRSLLSRLWQLLVTMADRYGKANLGLVAGGVAFSALFSLFPGIGAVVAVVSLWSDPVVASQELAAIEDLLPDQIYDLLDGRLKALLSAGRSSLSVASILSLGLSLFSARAGVSALMLGLNAVYGVRPRHNLYHVVLSTLLTVVLIVVIVTSLLLVVFIPLIMNTAVLLYPGEVSFGWGTDAARWGLVFIIMLTALGIVYRYGANLNHKTVPWVTPGAIFTIFFWFVATYLLSLYLSNFTRFNEVYGSIGAVIALQMWLYVSALLTLLGAVLNAELDVGRPRDTIRPEQAVGVPSTFE